MKRFLLFFFPFLLLFLVVGCAKPDAEPTLTDEEISLQQQETITIGFSSSEDEDHIEKILTPDEIMQWENPYGIYSSYYFYNTLTDDEKYVYRALEYAMVNSCERTHIDSRISVDRKRLERIVEYLSFDTPLLEQNLTSTVVPHITAFYDYQPTENRNVKVLHRSTTICISNFTAELWEKKMLALEEAKKVFATFDTNCSAIELAEQIYRYVAQIEYIPYENEYGHYKGHLTPFLHDAFINKKTHCDGFANSMALLFAMAGFEQVEKVGYTAAGGHTWNCVKIDGKWYNCDGTRNTNIPDETSSMGAGLGFAFSDALQVAKTQYETAYPPCDKSYYMEPDAYLENCEGQPFIDAVTNGFQKHGGWALIVIDTYCSDDQLQKLANASHSSITAYSITLASEKQPMLFIQN